ncbi:hypothetical protein [Mesorhizobium sp.]|uniref:hypothetical protein n=1 Tax=Mesorhizobium sp. TaxID=1871066 RepID=UPI001226436F|nr:hypothetical protein [Mesorhizobium sp.]TIM86007.1 MAG: hypothetical protein E5Y50_17080 [Mesorhizobium sp.]
MPQLIESRLFDFHPLSAIIGSAATATFGTKRSQPERPRRGAAIVQNMAPRSSCWRATKRNVPDVDAFKVN